MVRVVRQVGGDTGAGGGKNVSCAGSGSGVGGGGVESERTAAVESSPDGQDYAEGHRGCEDRCHADII